MEADSEELNKIIEENKHMEAMIEKELEQEEKQSSDMINMIEELMKIVRFCLCRSMMFRRRWKCSLKLRSISMQLEKTTRSSPSEQWTSTRTPFTRQKMPIWSISQIITNCRASG